MILSTTAGSVMTEMFFIFSPYLGHRSGATSKTFLISRDQEALLGEDVVDGASPIMFRARLRGMRQVLLKQNLTCSICIGPIVVPREVLAMVWNRPLWGSFEGMRCCPGCFEACTHGKIC